MKKILIISAAFPPEPVVSSLLSRDLAEELAKNNEVTVLSPKPTRPNGFRFEKEYEPENYKVIRLNSYTCPASKMIGRLRESYSFGKHCSRYLKDNSKHISCIYVNSWPLFSQYFIIRTAKKLKIASIIHVQDIYPESLLNKVSIGKSVLYKLLLPIDKYVLRNSTSIIAISENMKETLVKTRDLQPKKVSIVANWQNEEDFILYKNSKSSNVCNKSKDLFTFMYLGNIGPLAGVEFLINTFVKADIHNAELIIAGSGSKKNDCISLVKSINVANVKFVHVPEGMVPHVQDQADILLLPVKKNGAMSSIPSKLPAYMFSAKPIIGSLDLESDTAKAIEESGCGIVIEPENESEMIKALKKTCEWDQQTRDGKGNAGFEFAVKKFSKDRNLKKVVAIITDCRN